MDDESRLVGPEQPRLPLDEGRAGRSRSVHDVHGGDLEPLGDRAALEVPRTGCPTPPLSLGRSRRRRQGPPRRASGRSSSGSGSCGHGCDAWWSPRSQARFSRVRKRGMSSSSSARSATPLLRRHEDDRVPLHEALGLSDGPSRRTGVGQSDSALTRRWAVARERSPSLTAPSVRGVAPATSVRVEDVANVTSGDAHLEPWNRRFWPGSPRRTCASSWRAPAAHVLEGRGRLPPGRPRGVAPLRRAGPLRGPRDDAARRQSVLLDVLGPGDAFGELALLLPDERRSATVSALEAGETRSVYRGRLRPPAAESPGREGRPSPRPRASSCGGRARGSWRRTTSTPRRACGDASASSRSRTATADGEPVVPLTQEDLAAMAGTSRATVNRVLREEEKRGSVALERGRVTLLDAEARPPLPFPAELTRSAPLIPLANVRASSSQHGLAREVVEERTEEPVEARRPGDAQPFSRVRAARRSRARSRSSRRRGACRRSPRTRARRGRPRAGAPPRARGRRSARAVASSDESRSGRQGGYERTTSTSAPARRASASNRRDELVELGRARTPRHRRESQQAVVGARDVEARARLDGARESGAHRHDAARCRTEEVERTEVVARRPSARDRSARGRAPARRRSPRTARAARRALRSVAAGTRPRRRRERRRRPAPRVGSRCGSRLPGGGRGGAERASLAIASTRASALIAFVLPRAMSAPECPPLAPESCDRRGRTSRPERTSGRSGRRVNVCALPAQPTVIEASLVPSRFTRRRPVTSAGSSAFAPSSPCSSDTVRRSSSGPCESAGSSAAAIAPATPMPLSAPSVVPSASTQSPSRATWIRPSRGS